MKTLSRGAEDARVKNMNTKIGCISVNCLFDLRGEYMSEIMSICPINPFPNWWSSYHFAEIYDTTKSNIEQVKENINDKSTMFDKSCLTTKEDKTNVTILILVRPEPSNQDDCIPLRPFQAL